MKDPLPAPQPAVEAEQTTRPCMRRGSPNLQQQRQPQQQQQQQQQLNNNILVPVQPESNSAA